MVKYEKINILKLLIESQEPLSINQISKKRKINYKSAYENVMKLKALISMKKHGNSYLISFSKNFNHLVFQAEEERKQEFLKRKDVKAIYELLKKINKQFILLLFGSIAKRKDTKHSDIDLLLISKSKNIKEELGILPLNIHLTQINSEEFEIMLLSTEYSVISEALKLNIILFGIEDYYRMIQNAKDKSG